MAFHHHYANLVSEEPQAHTRLIRNYDGANSDFDIIIIGSGMAGGIIADDLAERHGHAKRILVLEAGAFLYPTHVYNVSQVPNFSIGRHFGVDNFWPWADSQHFIGEKPQMGFGGRSIFWSGLIPEAQGWELDYFPQAVRNDLSATYLSLAANRMNKSKNLGSFAEQVVTHFENSPLNNDFIIKQTPRALHQPYLNNNGSPSDQYFIEPTGVFNTAELLINQLGLTPGADQNGNGLFLKLNTFVEGIDEVPFDWYQVRTTETISGSQRSFYAPTVVIAAGSIESPKLINRSAIYQRLPDAIKSKVGYGLTDHPVTSESQAYVTGLGSMPMSRKDHAKIIFYSRGLNEPGQPASQVQFPFNIEMNINHEYWHLRNNDPSALPVPDNTSKARVDIKFSFANCLDDDNAIYSHATDGYVPGIRFKRFSDVDDLLFDRFPAVAGWNHDRQTFFNLLNHTRDRVFNEFSQVNWITGRYGFGTGEQAPFGWGTVHHACGTLRMPWRQRHDNPQFDQNSVVDDNLKVRHSAGMYVCDMSVMPISTAANPVRSLAALALRLSQHLS